MQESNISIHLIDDAVARVMRSEGGYIWACKNYDGDVMSDMVASAFGSLSMMTSVLVSPDGNFRIRSSSRNSSETLLQVSRRVKRLLLTPIATIFAWSGALRKRGQLDNNEETCCIC